MTTSKASNEPISLYVPARNAARTLPDCIASVRAQQRPPDEFFVVVDPRSDDETVSLARRLNVSTLEQHGDTLGAARNTAVSAAAHRWVACCDADVVLGPTWLATLAELRDSGHAGYGGRTVERVSGPCDAWRAMNMPHHWGEHRLVNPLMLVSQVLFDRDALLSVGGYRADLNHCEDSDLCRRLIDGGYNLLYEPAAVATHQRRDDLLSLMGLRFNHSEYRHRELMDGYRGLAAKLRINRHHAAAALARVLARGREELSYISWLLFHHHLLADLRSLHQRRPLIEPEEAVGRERQLLARIEQGIGRATPELAGLVARDLGGPAGPEPARLAPAWNRYLDDVAAGVEQFGRAVGSVRDIIAASAVYVRNPHRVSGMRRLSDEQRKEAAARAAELPLQPIVGPELIADLCRCWPDVSRLALVGRAGSADMAVIRQANEQLAGATGPAAAMLAHVEGFADPLRAFAEAARSYLRAAACYQSPTTFVPGLDVLAPLDLASAAAGAGWSIDRFTAREGRIQLLLSRRETKPGA